MALKEPIVSEALMPVQTPAIAVGQAPAIGNPSIRSLRKTSEPRSPRFSRLNWRIKNLKWILRPWYPWRSTAYAAIVNRNLHMRSRIEPVSRPGWL